MTEVTVEAVESVGAQTVALDLSTPDEFDAAPGQFVLVRKDAEGDAGYYTISSPYVEDTFEITVGFPIDESAEESLGTWLSEREAGDTVDIEGPLGHVQYRGEGDVVVYAAGPGIGPAIGIAERAVDEGNDATVVYRGEEPPHQERLDALHEAGATVALVDELGGDYLTGDTANVYVFGFDDFVAEAKALLEADERDPGDAAIESFGPA